MVGIADGKRSRGRRRATDDSVDGEKEIVPYMKV